MAQIVLSLDAWFHPALTRHPTAEGIPGHEGQNGEQKVGPGRDPEHGVIALEDRSPLQTQGDSARNSSDSGKHKKRLRWQAGQSQEQTQAILGKPRDQKRQKNDQNALVSDYIVVLLIDVTAHQAMHDVFTQKMSDAEIQHGADRQSDRGKQETFPRAEQIASQKAGHISRYGR